MGAITNIMMTWTYSPPNYLMRHKEWISANYELVIEDGKINLTRELDESVDPCSVQDEIDGFLRNIFNSIQLKSGELYELKQSVLMTISDGKVCQYLNCGAGIYVTSSVSKPTFIQYDKYGNEISNSREDEIECERKLFNLLFRYGDSSFVKKIMTSYRDSLIGDEYVLYRIYEIRDAFAKKYRGMHKSIKKIGGALGEIWEEIDQLANFEEVEQSRHKGQKLGSLRNLTHEETERARQLGRDMIILYLEYLDREGCT